MMTKRLRDRVGAAASLWDGVVVVEWRRCCGLLGVSDSQSQSPSRSTDLHTNSSINLQSDLKITTGG